MVQVSGVFSYGNHRDINYLPLGQSVAFGVEMGAGNRVGNDVVSQKICVSSDAPNIAKPLAKRNHRWFTPENIYGKLHR